MKMMQGAAFRACSNKIAHARRANAHEHLDELGAGDREERHARLAGYCARQKRLAGARRANQQNTLRIRAPSRPNDVGSRRKAPTSCTSNFASSTPATSLTVP